MTARFKARNEIFGKTVFDTNTFQHQFMTNMEFDDLKKEHEIKYFGNPISRENPSILYAPIRTYFDITLKCNLRCKTCLNRSGIQSSDELNVAEGLKVVEGIQKDGVFEVRFSGGEPTQKDGWDKIMQRAKELGLVVTLNTNGIYDKNTLHRLIEINPDETTISLDGFKEHNDLIRGNGSFEKATNSIKVLKEKGCRVTINSVITSLTADKDIRDLLDFANQYCNDISFFHARPIGRASNMKLPNYDDLKTIMDKIDNWKNEYPRLRVRTRSSSLKSSAINENLQIFGLMTGGPDGFTRFNIMPNGDLYAGGCVPYVDKSMKKFCLGKIVDENYSVLNVWRLSDKLKKIREASSMLKNECDNCDEKSCHKFTLELVLYESINPGGNIYCKKHQKWPL